jgi:epsilon-lactone hydrolase
MASKQSEQLATYYKGVIGALAVNPEMPLDEMRAIFEHWGDVTA